MPPDVVRLRDGTFLRGIVVERSPERVVVMLPTGETRVYAATEVEAAGPAEDVLSAPAAPTADAPSSPTLAPREAEPPSSPPTPPRGRHPDAVRLHDGTSLRGTITERDAEHIVIVLPTGAARTLSMTDVAAAGPADEVLEAAPRRASSARSGSGALLARVRVTSDQPDLSLHRVTQTTAVPTMVGNVAGSIDVDTHELVCSAPCTTELAAGTYQLAIARGDGSPHRAGPPVGVFDGAELVLHYQNRSAVRTAGALTWIGGGAAGLGLVLAGMVGGPSDEHGRIIDVPLVVGGAVTIAVAMLIGIPLAFWNDGGRVEVRF
ncbi:hypothetical protein DB32_005526 [Sandaracinus amylolyticus]|uniref:Uncharacterized protein n=1 Tax=Sandaracinus amylolyticus TaxID=927083 RepID=A0A0F6W696_9BACT|nr:hypothetical protein DB32_005526 [Sandaracinus amylolyticus]